MTYNCSYPSSRNFVIVGSLFKSFEHCSVVFLLPLFVGFFDFLPHLIESILEHLGEICTHVFNILLESIDLRLLFGFDLFNVSLQVGLLLLQDFYFFFIIGLSLLEPAYLLEQLLLHRLVLTGHIRDNVHLELLLILNFSFQL